MTQKIHTRQDAELIAEYLRGLAAGPAWEQDKKPCCSVSVSPQFLHEAAAAVDELARIKASQEAEAAGRVYLVGQRVIVSGEIGTIEAMVRPDGSVNSHRFLNTPPLQPDDILVRLHSHPNGAIIVSKRNVSPLPGGQL